MGWQGGRSGDGRRKLWESLKAEAKLEVRCPKTGWIRRGLKGIY